MMNKNRNFITLKLYLTISSYKKIAKYGNFQFYFYHENSNIGRQ